MNWKLVGLVFGILAAFTLAMAALHGKLSEPRVITVVDTVDNAYLRARLETQSKVLADVFHENDGLRGALQKAENRIRGLEAREPSTILIAVDPVDVSKDSLARPTVAVTGGIATYSVLIPRAESLHEERFIRVDVRDCDDGYVLGVQGAACNTATFGHLLLFARPGIATPADSLLRGGLGGIRPIGEIGFSWRKCYRCATGAEVRFDSDSRFTALGQVGVQIF